MDNRHQLISTKLNNTYMRYLILPDSTGPYTDADKKTYHITELSDTAKVSGPIKPITADNEADAAKQAGLTWITGRPKPLPVKPFVPASIAPVQLRLWLARHGITDAAVLAAIDAQPDANVRTEAHIRWEYSLEILRGNPLVAALAAALHMDTSATDDAFREASKL